ncbi:histone-lysine N-methyltransferase SETMAR [Trichonephila clavipes]|nr:histone-lysine N-methyltransferase SETMAR [Trichonephila clavipes]
MRRQAIAVDEATKGRPQQTSGAPRDRWLMMLHSELEKRQHAVEPGATVNGSYYANVLRTMTQHVKRKRSLLRNGFLLHHDNVPPHIARCVLDVSQQNNVEFYHALHTVMFPQLKKPLRGKRFASNKACVRAAEAILMKPT